MSYSREHLTAPRIHRVNVTGTALKKAIGEASRGCADVRADRIRNVDLKFLKCAVELYTSAADESTSIADHGYVVRILYVIRRLCYDFAADCDVTARDQLCRTTSAL